MLDINYFGIWDYVVVSGTLLFSLFIGVYYAVVSKQTNEELLVGGRQMNVFAISASMLVTHLSAVTVLGYPAEIYANGIQIFLMTLLTLVFVPISTYMFISVFYKMKLTSVYEYLERRYDTVAVRWLASLSFILKGTVLTGVILYAPSIALEKILGLPVWISIVGIGTCGTVYTAIGGLKAVVWTDVFQFVMIIVGMMAIVTKGFYSSGGFLEAFRIAKENGRLELFDFTVDPFMRHNTLNFVLGNGFSIICQYGTYQQQVQRYCSLPSFSHALKAVALSVALKIFTVSLVVSTGIALFATYAGCDPLRLGLIKKADQIVPHFVVTELSFLPGIMGLFVSCIFSAVLSSVSSTLNSLSAVTWEDFLSHIPACKKMKPKTQANLTRSIAFLYGIICIGLAFVAQRLGAIFQAAMTAVGAFSGPLGAIFIMGLFIPCVNKWGAVSGMTVGLATMMYVTINKFMMAKPYHATLPTSIDSCPPGTNFSLAYISTTSSNVTTTVDEIEWPQKIFTISYILYPFVGALITTTVGIIVGILTGGCSEAKRLDRAYLHPILHKCGCCPLQEQQQSSQMSTHKRADRLSGQCALNATISSQHVLSTGSKYEPVPTVQPEKEFERL